MRTAVRSWFRRSLFSAEHEVAAAHVKLARFEIEQAVRHQLGIARHDLRSLRGAVLGTVPEDQRVAVGSAVDSLQDAETEELVVREHVAFAIGLAIGQLHAALKGPAQVARGSASTSPTTTWFPWIRRGEKLGPGQGNGPRVTRREDIAFVGRLIRAHREAAGTTPHELARKAGLGYGSAWNVERGFNARLSTVGRLATALGPKFSRVLVEMLVMPTFQRRALTECRRADMDLRKVSEAIDALLK